MSVVSSFAVAAGSNRREDTEPVSDSAIRPLHVQFSDDALADLRRRIEATRWPERETVTGRSQGVPLATVQKLARYWSEYDCSGLSDACV
jgi:Epoxide hydrolase N terminus